MTLNKNLLRICAASLCLFAGAVSADVLSPPVTLSSGDPLLFSEINQIKTGQCFEGHCAELHTRIAEFEKYPDFTWYLTQTLLSMASTIEGKPAKFENVEGLRRYFENNATPKTSEYLQANVLRSQTDLVVVDLVHYIFSGGAHGETTSQYVNWLPQTKQVASLSSMLLPGALPRYEQALREQHQTWLKEQSNAIGDTKAFLLTWPFKPTDNVALMPDGLTVTYARYEIGPGSFGQPSFVIPYSKLTNVLKPEYLKVAIN